MRRTDWKTPKWLYDHLNGVFNFNCDPCPSDPGLDGLSAEWGTRTFVNPPYNALPAWLNKALEEREKGKFILLLLPAKTGTAWWQDLVQPNAAFIWFLRDRLCFDDRGGRAPFPSALVCFYRYDRIKEWRPHY